MSRPGAWIWTAIVLWPTLVAAAALEVEVRDVTGAPVSDAVVFALGPDGAPPPAVSPATAVIDQIDKEFVPWVTAVTTGTAIAFPNRDEIRHHVYSFSPARTFELPLYRGIPAEPIVFDRPGTVTLGCNIHDWMTAYVFVSPTPYFTLTGAEGRASVTDLPAGAYDVRVWHPALAVPPEVTTRRVRVPAGASRPLAFAIERKRLWRARRAPAGGGAATYR